MRSSSSPPSLAGGDASVLDNKSTAIKIPILGIPTVDVSRMIVLASYRTVQYARIAHHSQAWTSLKASGFTSSVPRLGSSHAWANTMPPAIAKVLGWAARDGPQAWDPSRGNGAVTARKGDYDDALRRKRNAVILFLVELSGALSPPAKRHLRWLAARAKRRDTTPYESWAAAAFMAYWIQRLSAAIVGGDARRGLTALARRAGLLLNT